VSQAGSALAVSRLLTLVHAVAPLQHSPSPEREHLLALSAYHTGPCTRRHSRETASCNLIEESYSIL